MARPDRGYTAAVRHRTVADPSEIDAEIQALLATLGR
jgi:hypothetical protein